MYKIIATITLLQFLGVVVILSEFIIPSAGLLSLIATGLIGYSLYYAYYNTISQIFITLGILDILMIPFLIWIGVKILANSPLSLKTNLNNNNTSYTRKKSNNEELIGKNIIAITPLRPSGKALLNNRNITVVSNGDFIEKGTTLKIISVEGNKIVVEPQTTN